MTKIRFKCNRCNNKQIYWHEFCPECKGYKTLKLWIEEKEQYGRKQEEIGRSFRVFELSPSA